MQRVIRFKRYAYALFLIPLVLPPAGLMLGAHYAVPDWGAWLTVLVVFGLVPLLDTCLGRDTANPGPDEERALLADPDWANKVRDGRIDELIGFEAEVDLDEGIRRTAEAYQAQK